MKRNSYLVSATIQFENPIQPPQWGAHVILTSVAVVTNEEGVQIYQPSYLQQPATSDDITDEVLAALQTRLAILGLNVSRATEA